VLQPNESTIAYDIAASDDYSVTLKDDGKLLYRWGNTVKRPNDIRFEAQLPLPDEWSEPDAAQDDLIPLFRITQAELAVQHTITNNPNDQIRPEDFENESAIGQLPTYEVLDDGRWVTTGDYYAGDGTFYPAGTVLRDPALAAAAANSDLADLGALSADLSDGFTNAWYKTMDREPFEAELDENGDYISGPRWRLQPDKYGQDLPSVVIPEDPSLPPPPTKDQVKYEAGEDTQTLINLLDWEFAVSPLSISAGWQNNSGQVSENGLNMTPDFDVAFYLKGDVKPATIYNSDLLMDYEELTIHGEGGYITGTGEDDYLAGQGSNTFIGDAKSTERGQDMFVLSYGVNHNLAQVQSSTILDFEWGRDTLGLIDLGVNDTNFGDLITQTVTDGNLDIQVGGYDLVSLNGVDATLGIEDFLLVNRLLKPITGTDADDYLVGTPYADILSGGLGNDTLFGFEENDTLYGNAGNDVLSGGLGDDNLDGAVGADDLDGGSGVDRALYDQSSTAVTVDLAAGTGSGGDANGDSLASIENVTGSRYDDTLVGNAQDNILAGRKGADALSDGVGNDLFNGGVGGDTLDGGDGMDAATYRYSNTAVTVNLSTGLGSGGQAEGDTLINIEAIIGSKFDDTLTGDALSNTLEGRAGADSLSGGAGDDLLNGGGAGDMLDGGDGKDTATYAGSANGVTVNLATGLASGGQAEGDVLANIENLEGSSSADTLTGNSLANRLAGGNGDDTLDGGAGYDTFDGGAGPI
jgi:Ca2+-binding RTX toxin-like protein